MAENAAQVTADPAVPLNPTEPAPVAPVAAPKYPSILTYENEALGVSVRAHIVDNDDHWLIDVETLEGEPPRNWAMLKAGLGLIFPHGRTDFPALMDFIQAAWQFAKPPRDSAALIQPTEQQIKVGQVAHKFSKELLAALDITTFNDFGNVVKVVQPYTVLYADQQAAKEAEKARKKAEKAANRTAEQELKAAEKKAEREKAKAEKKAIKDAEKAKAKAEKEAAKAAEKESLKAEAQAKIDAAKAAAGDTPKPKKPNKAERQAAMRANVAPPVAEAAPLAHEGDGWRDTPPAAPCIDNPEEETVTDAILNEGNQNS